jgi:TonB-linked SusC/RagA family outer membrane protein
LINYGALLLTINKIKHMKRILLTFLFLSVVTLSSVYAQSRKITGRVTGADDGQALPGVSVKVTGTNTGVQTDNDGLYSLQLPANAQTLTFSFIGYNPQTVTIGQGNRYDVKLTPNNKQLSEVVVIGYGTVLKRDATSAISSVSAKDIEDRPITGIDQALQGQAAGVQVTSASGAPGGGVSVKVRGTSSINSSSQPLYVVDGTPINISNLAQLAFGNQQPNPLDDINPNDIESLEVLKDAAATAIYGSRGTNGVVIVTTKHGKAGPTKIDVNYYTGIQNVTKEIPLLNGPQYIKEIQDEVNNRFPGSIGAGAGQFATIEALTAAKEGAVFGNPANTYPTSNWEALIFRKNAPISDYNIAISGGADKTKFTMSGDYFDQQGTIFGSDYKRLSFRTSIDHNITDKLKVGSNFAFNYTTQDRLNNDNNINGVLSTAILQGTAFPVYNADGTYNKGIGSVENPVAAYKEPLNLTTNGRLLANVYGEYQILPNLTFRSNFAADYTSFGEQRFSPTTLNAGFAAGGSGTQSQTELLNVLNENTLTYKKSIGKHNFTVLAGESFQKESSQVLLASGTGFPGNQITQLSAAAVKTNAFSTGSSDVLESYFARVNYNFDEKYLFSASIRDDASSRFGVNKRDGVFPAVSAGWRINQENFLKNVSWLSNLKLRGSYGITGNNNIADFASRTLVNGGANYNGLPGLSPAQLGSSNLAWESTAQTDVAIDFGFFNDRLTLSIDYYDKESTNLLLAEPLVGVSGFTSTIANIGKLQNKGLEVDVQSINVKSSSFSWTTNFNIAFNRNKVLALANGNTPFGSGFASWIQVGQPLGAFRGYQTAGIFQSQAEIDALNAAAKAKTGKPTATYQTTLTAPGDIKFADLNGDGVVNTADQHILGSAQPLFIGGLTNTFKYKSFDLNFFWQFSYGNKIFNNTRAFAEGQNSVFGDFATVLNRWTPTNTNTNMPRAVLGDPNQNNRTSDRFLEDGSYARLKNAALGYTLPKSAAKAIGMRSLRVYVSAQNLITITKYSGFDPELSTFDTPGQNNTAPGTDFLTVPQAKTILVGVNVGF